MRECCGKQMQAEIVRPGLVRYRCLECGRAIFRARRSIVSVESKQPVDGSEKEKSDD